MSQRTRARRAYSKIRDAIQRDVETRLARLVAWGTLDARQLSAYHWRIWRPAAPAAWLDFWPRTGTIRDHQGYGRGSGWEDLLSCFGLSPGLGGARQRIPQPPYYL